MTISMCNGIEITKPEFYSVCCVNKVSEKGEILQKIQVVSH